MKKIIVWALVLALCVGMLAGCEAGPGETTASNETTGPAETTAPAADNGLADAVAYIRTVYKDAAEITGKDYDRIGLVPMGDVTHTVTWSADVSEDLISFTVAENGKVTVNVNEDCEQDTPYVLTATITAPDGASETLSWNHILPAGTDVDGLTYGQIVELGYGLAEGAALEDAYRLYGTITAIDTPWSEEYKNITVTIQVGDMADKTIQCYRLAGEGAKDLAVGDAITVEGILKNYKGTIEFDSGCTLVGLGEHVDQKALLKAAFALGEGVAMDYPAVLTGVVDAIPTAYSAEYGNVTVNIKVDEQIVQCYRLKGEGADAIAVGDTITVAGVIKNYKGTVEFDAGCLLVPNDAYHSVKNALSAYKLEEGAAQETAKTITGVIASIDTEYSADYGNVTVTIVVAGLEDYKIQCYRLTGEDKAALAALAVGDTVTVTGTLKNYKGTYEFDAGCTLDAVVKAG